MAVIKNFNLGGVDSDVQFGKAGPRLHDDAGVFTFSTKDKAELIPIKALDLTLEGHALADTMRVETELFIGAEGTTGGIQADTAQALYLLGGDESSAGALDGGDLILTAGPGGAIKVSSQRIQEVAEPVELTDAATKGYVDTAVANLHTAVTTEIKGATVDRTVQITFAQNSPTIITLPAGSKLRRITLKVTAAYGAGSQIAVWDGVSTYFLTEDLVDETTVGLYSCEVNTTLASDTTLRVKVDPIGMEGTGIASIEYVGFPDM